MLDHSFTLQAVMELQKSVGELTVKVDRLIQDVGGHGTELRGITQKINLFLGGAAVVGVIAGVMLTIALQIPWGRLFEQRTPNHAPPALQTLPSVPKN